MKRHFSKPQQKKVDPSKFNDLMALKTCWDPLHSHLNSVHTRQLVRVHSSRIEFKIIRTVHFLTIFLLGLSGLSLMTFSLFLLNQLPIDMSMSRWAGFGITLSALFIFFIVLSQFYIFRKCLLFLIKEEDSFGKAIKNHGCLTGEKVKIFAKLDDIYALQLYLYI